MFPRHRGQQRVIHIAVWLFIALGFVTIACAADDPPEKRVAPAPPAASAGVDPGWSQTIQENIRRSEYNFSQHGEGRWAAPNRATDLRTFVTPRGIEVVSRTRGAEAFDLTLSLARWGRHGSLASIDAGSQPPTITVKDSRAVIRHRGLEEWFVNDERGLEHAFAIQEKPGGEGPLVLELAVGGDLEPVADPRGESIRFEKAGGAAALEYGSLAVRDAGGRSRPARFVADGRLVRIEVDDAVAEYPITIDPLITPPAWSAEGDQTSARFGYSVASAGDVNGDGFSDIVVGAPYYDNGETDEGRAYMYLGSSAGLSATPSWTTESDQAGDLLGFSVASAGDVNGDGYSDVIIGTSLYGNGQVQEGRAQVYLGSGTGLATLPGWSAEGDNSLAQFGYSVASAGDVNGDGFSDVIVGAFRFHNGESEEGGAFVYLGSGTGLDLSPAWTAEGNQAGAYFGRAVASAGDVNGDGYDDVIVGADGFDNGETDEGAAFVYLGSAAGVSGTPVWTNEINQADARYGGSVGTAGDVNGDGYSDIIVGAPLYDWFGKTDRGAAYFYHGSASGPAAAWSWSFLGNQANELLGYSVATAGDVDGDGYSDVIVGAPLYNGSLGLEGRILLFTGSTSGLPSTPDWTVESHSSLAEFGSQVASAGDVNGDGLSDIIVGAESFDNGQGYEGGAFAYYGSCGDLLSTTAWSGEGDQAGAQFGVSVASAGDVDADGYDDILVGAWMYDNGEANEGRAFMYPGSPAGPASTPSWSAEGDQAAALFGYTLRSAGDVNGDGYSDVIVGAPSFDNGENNEGQAFLYLGSASGLSPVPDWTGQGDQAEAQYAQSVAGAGDVNGDGYADVVVGAPFFDFIGLIDTGRAYLYLGSASGLSPTPLWIGEGGQNGGELGVSVASAGDVNGDGYDDIIVGAWLEDNGQTDEGRAYVYVGSASGPAQSPSWSAEGDQAASAFGLAVAAAGDVNADGYADVLVGARSFDNGEIDEGRAYLYLGSSSGLASTAAWTMESNQAGAEFGIALGTAGDVNVDGYSDVIIGARYYDNGETDEGAAFIYAGSASGASSLPYWTGEIDQGGAEFGAAVASAGDVNGDGHPDVIVGARYYDNGESDEGAAFVYLGSCDNFLLYSGGPQINVQNAGASTQLSWAALPGATAYDIIQGDLGELLISGGDFSRTTTRCIANDLTGTLQYDRTSVAVGEAIFFLVRGLSVSVVGSYDTIKPGQIGSRDAEIAGSIGACP